jgi:drug/metabolite transporter (DMT)-like permease
VATGLRRDHLDPVAAGMLVLLCALWGFNQVTIKLAAPAVPPAMQAGLRSLVAVVLLLGWMRLRRIPLPGEAGAWRPGLLAGSLFSLEFALLYAGLAHTSASRAVIFLYTAPFVVTAGVHYLVPDDRLGRLQTAGMVLAFAGVVIIFGGRHGAAPPLQWLGDLLALGAGVAWGITTLVVRATRLARVDPACTLFYQLAVSALVLPILSMLLLREPSVTHVTPLVVACVAYQSIIVAFASYLSWFWLVARYPAPKISGYTFLAPVFGVLSGIVVLDEPLTAALVAGAALVAAGIYLVNWRQAGSAARP